jgi:hypothetical protein
VKKFQVSALAALWLLTTPVFAEPSKRGTNVDDVTTGGQSNEIPKKEIKSSTELKFVDAEGAYWVNKGFNDTMFGVNPGSFNEARHERDQSRFDAVINGLNKKTTVDEVIYQGKVLDQNVTPLKMQGRSVPLPR